MAIKVIPLDGFTRENTRDDINKRIQTMNKCNHQNILGLHTSFTNEKDLYVVMPLMAAGSLKSILKQKVPNGIKDESLIASVLLQMVEGLVYFHSKQLLHRDIKAENFLLDETGQIKLSQFNLV